jgi:CRISPR-associated helicase Cas3
MRLMVEPLWYEKLATPFVQDATGTSLSPYIHQEKTLARVRDAIRTRKTICLLNESVTGSGKTLANFAAAILDGTRTIGVYPTNELVADQYVSLSPFLPALKKVVLDSAGMDDILATFPWMHSHAHALDWATNDFAPLGVLTNPDVLYLILYSLYGQMFSTFDSTHGARAFRQILKTYPVIAFDEFHLYNAKQVANAAFIVGAARVIAPDSPHIFIFSSATPDTQIMPYLQRLGLENAIFNVTAQPVSQGKNARVVCEPVEVNLLPANLFFWKGNDALQLVWKSIHADWADTTTPQACGVYIVDSVYEAKMVAEQLRASYGADQVGEVHGYMDPFARGNALLRRLSVGTTTIDVGVDLTGKKSKEYAYAEARSAAQGIQRVGRLGRRGREPATISIPNRAWLAVPEYVYEYMRRRLTDGAALPRLAFTSMMNAAYLSRENFQAYTQLYSPLEAVAACKRILAQEMSDTHDDTEQKLHMLVATLFDKQPPATQVEADASYIAYSNRQWEIWRQFGTPIREVQGQPPSPVKYYLSDLESFRGGLESDFVVAIYDELDAAIKLKPVKTYTLPFVLRRTIWKELSTRVFYDLVRKRHPLQADAWIAELQQQRNLLGYLHVTSLVQGKANTMAFEIRKSAIRGRFQQVIRMNGFSISAPGGAFRTGDDSIMGRLQKRTLNCWVSEFQSFDVPRLRNLPPLFAVYPLHAISPAGHINQWSIAIGTEAFFLDSICSSQQQNITLTQTEEDPEP